MDFTWEIIFFLLILSFLAGSIATIAGVGGGVLWVPMMTILLAMPINVAVDTSTLIILITSLVGFLTYLKDKRLEIKQVLIFSSFSILGGISCSILLIFLIIENTILKIIFAIVIMISGLNMMNKANKTRKSQKRGEDAENKEFKLDHQISKEHLKKGIPLFFFAGFLSYLLGVGGGIINTPVLNLIFGYPIHFATATSTGIIFFTQIFNTILKISLGRVIDYGLGLIIAIGAVVGSVFGAKISNKIPRLYLQIFVAIVLIVLAINMFF